MNIVVTGSLGNISQPLARQLVQEGNIVTVVSSKPDRRLAIEALGARAAIGMLENVAFLTNTFTGADAVYCMLPPFDYMDPTLDLMAAARLLANTYAEAIRQSGVKRVVHLSSVGAHLGEGSGLLLFHHLVERILDELPADVSITHLRPVGFYNNLYAFTDMIKGRGLLGHLLTLRFMGLGALLTGKTGIIAANYGGAGNTAWVSPVDIAAAVAEALTSPLAGRTIRYVASDELTGNQVARILGAAIGKPYLRWVLLSDQQMAGGLKRFGLPPQITTGMVEMNAAQRTGKVDEDYFLNRPHMLGNVKMTDFARQFARAYNQT